MMEPGSVTLICGDSNKIKIKTLKHKVRMILVDPPFGISNNRNIDNDFNGYTSNKGEWDTISYEWLHNLDYYLMPGGVFGCFGNLWNLVNIYPVVREMGYILQSHIVVHKTNPAPSIHRRMYTHANELIGLWSHGKNLFFDYDASKLLANGKQLHNVWESASVKRIMGRTRKHPSIVKKLILPLSRPGDIIMDLFCGSCSILEIAATEGRISVGIDNDNEIIEKSVELLSENNIPVCHYM